MTTTAKLPAAATIAKVGAKLTATPQSTADVAKAAKVSEATARKALVNLVELNVAEADEATAGWKLISEAKTADGTPVTKAVAKATKAAKATTKKQTAPKPEKGVDDGKVKGYLMRWPHGAYDLYKRAAATKVEGNSQWVIRCTAHGTQTTAEDVKAADALGRRADRPAWCAGCRKDAAAKAAPAGKATKAAPAGKATKAATKASK